MKHFRLIAKEMHSATKARSRYEDNIGRSSHGELKRAKGFRPRFGDFVQSATERESKLRKAWKADISGLQCFPGTLQRFRKRQCWAPKSTGRST